MWTVNPPMTIDSIKILLFFFLFLLFIPLRSSLSSFIFLFIFFDHQVIKALPKADLNCRLAGSVSAGVVWKELKDAGIDMKSRFGITCTTEVDLRSLLRPAHGHTKESLVLAGSIIKSVLQTAPQLERAVRDVSSLRSLSLSLPLL